MNKFDEIERLNRIRAETALSLYAVESTNVPSDPEGRLKLDMQCRLIRDAWLKAESDYIRATDSLTHAEMIELIQRQIGSKQ